MKSPRRSAFGTSRLASGDVSHFPSGRSPASNRRWFAGMLVSSAPMRVGSRDHSLSLHNGPLAPPRLLQEPFWPGLEERLLSATSAGHNSNHRPTVVIHVNRPPRGHT